MPNIAINELELNDNLDGTEVFASIEIGNGVTYQSRVSAIHYTDSVCEGQIKDSSVTNTKIANNSVDNNKIVNTDNYVVNKITTCEFSLGSGKVFCTQGATANYQWPNSTPGQANLFLTSNSNGEMSWSQPSSDGTSQTFLVNSPSTPVGTITEWVGTSPPEGWLLCNGSAVSRTTYEDLFDLFNGFTPALPYGVGDGSTTFNLPSFAGRTLIGSGSTTDSAGQLSTFSLYTSGGEFDHTLTTQEIPAHKHLVASTGSDGTGVLTNSNTIEESYNFAEPGSQQPDNPNFEYILHGTTSEPNVGLTNEVGGDQPHNNIQPYAVVNYIIKAKSDIIVDFNPTLTGGLSALDGEGLFTSTSLDLSSSQLGVYVDETTLGFCTNNKLTIVDNAITSSKICNNAITTVKICDNAITNEKICDNAITNGKICDNAITNGKICDGTISLGKFNDITAGKVLGRGPSESTGSPQEIDIVTDIDTEFPNDDSVASAKSVKTYVEFYVDCCGGGGGGLPDGFCQEELDIVDSNNVASTRTFLTKCS